MEFLRVVACFAFVCANPDPGRSCVENHVELLFLGANEDFGVDLDVVVVKQFLVNVFIGNTIVSVELLEMGCISSQVSFRLVAYVSVHFDESVGGRRPKVECS